MGGNEVPGGAGQLKLISLISWMLLWNNSLRQRAVRDISIPGSGSQITIYLFLCPGSDLCRQLEWQRGQFEHKFSWCHTQVTQLRVCEARREPHAQLSDMRVRQNCHNYCQIVIIIVAQDRGLLSEMAYFCCRCSRHFSVRTAGPQQIKEISQCSMSLTFLR